MRLYCLLPFALAAPVIAQTCTTSICTAASVSQADFLSALPSTCPTGTTVVNIPSGTGVWVTSPGQVTYTVPANCLNLTIQGQTTVSCTGTAGTSSYACTLADSTIIQDNIGANFGVLQINGSSGVNPILRVTGITMNNGSGGNKFQGLLLFYSNNAGSQLRIDHDHFNLTTGTSGTGWAGRLNGCFTGVGDHNLFDNSSPTNTSSVAQGFMNSNTCHDSLGNGDGSWAVATNPGSSDAFYWENNVFNGGLSGDCVLGGKFVDRYNTYNSDTKSSSLIHNHGTALNNGRVRGCRWFEAYHNYFNPATAGSVFVGDAGGSGMVWGNTFSRTSSFLLAVGDERNDGQHPQTANPNGWGFCGKNTIDPNTGLANNVGSGWDGNSNVGTGWPCLDGIGRGQGIQALNGANFSSSPVNPVNSTTGTIAWPEEYLEPVYAWMNTLLGTTPLSIASPATIQNRDVYVDNASFAGATGTGFGLHSARPVACTAGPGGTYGASPTGAGSEGVGYFSTDTQTFSVCTVSGNPGTWVDIYTPYTYPHPLVSSTPQAATPTFSPSTGVPPQTVTTSDSTAGATLCGRNDGGTPTATTPGTCDSSPTFTISGTQSVTINPTTLTAIGTKTGFLNSGVASSTYGGPPSTCGNPTELGPNYGGTYNIPPPTLPMTIGFVSPTAGCNMFYTVTTNGTTPAAPTCAGTAYPGGNFQLTAALIYRYRVIACQGGFTSSAIQGDQWTVTTPTGLWNSFAGWDTCILPGCNPGGSGTPVSTSQIIGNQTPALSGSAMSMSLVANVNSTNALWTWFGADCDLCTSFSADFQVYPVSSSNLGALELDTAFLFSTGLNREFMWGMQYCLLGAGCPGGHNSWDIWNQGTGTWIDTGITTAPNFGAWNHVQTTNHRVGNTQWYDTLTLNGTLHAINMSEATSVLPGGWTSGTGFQFQLDASTPSGSQTYTMYLDQASFSSFSIPPPLSYVINIGP